METFLETYNLPKLNQEAESLNRLITTSEIETVINKLLAHKCHGLDDFTGDFYQTFKGELISFSKDSKRFKKREGSQTLFTRPVSS